VVVAKGSSVKRVILCGYHTQQVKVPMGIEVVEMFYEGREQRGLKGYLYAYYNTESPRVRPAIQAIHKLTGQEVASYQGASTYDGSRPLFVDTVRNDERLRSDYPRVTPPDQLPALKFSATRLIARDRFSWSALHGEFTATGPQKKTLEGLPDRMLQVAYDPTAKQYYGITGHELHTVNLKDGTSEKIEPPAGVDPNWLRALTFDAKRDRLVISGRKALYEYSTKNKQWAVLIPNNKGSFAGLAWQTKTDTLYAISEELLGDGQVYLYELNARGAVVAKTLLQRPMFPGVLSLRSGDNRAELIDLGSDLAALVYRETRDSDTGEGGKPENPSYSSSTPRPARRNWRGKSDATTLPEFICD
jgi:hypothetical protein